MEKEYAPTKQEKKTSNMVKTEHSHEHKHEHNEEHKHEHSEHQTAEVKTEEKKEVKKPAITKKEEAVALGSGIAASKKHSMYICDFIKGKPIDQAISELQEVLKFKRAIPMKGEIPHRKGKGMMSGRYPINTSKIFINILKALRGNVIVNGLALERTKIYYGSASWASRPQRSGGVSAKRTNVVLKAKEFPIVEAKK